MNTNIVLIGFMGTGKTAVGKRLAGLLNMEFYDTDQEVEAVTGMSITQLYNKYGEVRFISEETLAVKRLTQKNNSVIATGGGVVLNKENLALLKEKGILISLFARPEIIYERVKRRNNRPILKKGDLLENILKLNSEREEIYNSADIHIDTSDLEFSQIIDRVLFYLKEYDKGIDKRGDAIEGAGQKKGKN
ncbi:MAG: shikimate kinase [Firmicutes bacterium HGW-Firmicutes-12]|jgi:shikimate kinase|nr:MAG: shikimate kinase [Firmicutes bacterium HGW-Firmicutes-12]